MYKRILRPLLFLIDPEKVHHLIVSLIKCVLIIPGMNTILRKIFTYHHPLLSTKVAGLEFPAKVGLAAGFDKNADFYNEFSVFGFSFIEIGTVTPVAQPGNNKPRLFRLPKDKALINRMGFNNKGAEYAAKKLHNNKRYTIIGGNIGKNTGTDNSDAASDYLKCFKELYDQVDYFTVNVSCPNVKDLDKLQNQESLTLILRDIIKYRQEKAQYKPIFLKISPDLTFGQIDETLQICQDASVDGIIATNTTTGRECLNTENRFIQKFGNGGLSGKPLKQRSLQIVSYICKQTKGSLPVIAVGGILTAGDALDMIKAGASLVQVYTGFIYEGPFIVKKINKAIARYLSSNLNKMDID